MKKSLALILGLCIFLFACTAGNGPETIGDPTTTPPTSSQTTTIAATAETGGTDETVVDNSSEPTNSTTVSDATEATDSCETMHETKSTASPAANLEDHEAEQPNVQTNETEPSVTSPPELLPEETESTDPLPTETETVPTQSEQMDPPNESAAITDSLDCNEAMECGNVYGSSTYRWTVDMTLNEHNSGFHFGSWVFAEDGQAALDSAGIGQIDFLYNSMKEAYPDMEITGIRFRVHAFKCGDGLYEVRVYYA